VIFVSSVVRYVLLRFRCLQLNDPVPRDVRQSRKRYSPENFT
jgi:hypothetical protein